jgi:hypothetical protein
MFHSVSTTRIDVVIDEVMFMYEVRLHASMRLPDVALSFKPAAPTLYPKLESTTLNAMHALCRLRFDHMHLIACAFVSQFILEIPYLLEVV